MSKTRIIKKYPNRRLYDTEISKYITLDNIRQLVIKNINFIVKDIKTDEDLTRGILLQIISEQEHNGEPFFSASALSQIIRFYDNSMQSLAGDFITKSLELFVNQQKQMQDAVTANPLTAMDEITEKNLNMWQDMQEVFFKAANLNSDKEKR